jgi:hypothetical protein
MFNTSVPNVNRRVTQKHIQQYEEDEKYICEVENRTKYTICGFDFSEFEISEQKP